MEEEGGGDVSVVGRERTASDKGFERQVCSGEDEGLEGKGGTGATDVRIRNEIVAV